MAEDFAISVLEDAQRSSDYIPRNIEGRDKEAAVSESKETGAIVVAVRGLLEPGHKKGGYEGREQDQYCEENGGYCPYNSGVGRNTDNSSS